MAAGLTLALLAGCGQETASGTPIRFGIAEGPVTLDPRFATDATAARLVRLLYASLVDFDEALRPVPSLARWSALAPTHYRFRLGAEGRTLPGGGRIDARDVKATYEDVLDPARGSPHRAGLALVERIEVIDEDTVDFRLRSPDLLFPGKLVLGILPRALLAAGHPFNTEPVGSGPFRLRAWPNEGRLVLERRGDGQRVELLRLADPTTRVLKLLNREVDMLQGDLSPEVVRWLEHRPGLVVQRSRGIKFSYLGFNLEDPVVGDRRVRTAIAHAIDRAAILRYVMGGAGRLASSILPPEHWAGHPDLPLLAPDRERARALLAEAGYRGRGPRIVYKTSADPFRVRLATILQSQLAEVGVELEVQSHDWGTFYGDVKAGRFQMYSLAWVGIKMPDIFRYTFHSSAVPPHGANRGRYASETADRLIEAAEREPTLAGQAARYRALQELVLAELPYVPLWYEDNFLVTTPGLDGYQLGSDGSYDGLLTVRRGPAASAR